MKKIIALLLCILALLPASALAYTAGELLYAAEPVNLREGPSTRYAVITELEMGQAVRYLGRSGSWSRVSWNGRIGYVFTKYLSETQLLPGTSAAAATEVNVRSGPGTGYKRLGTLEKGESVVITGRSGNWYGVEWQGRAGYVYYSYLTPYMQYGANLGIALDESGYFDTNRALYLGRYVDASDMLHIRVVQGADVEGIERDLDAILTGRYAVEASALPSYVNADYIESLQNRIKANYEGLSAAEKARCPLSSFNYDPETDQFVVGIAGLDTEKIQLFRQWILDWEYVSFTSEAQALPSL